MSLFLLLFTSVLTMESASVSDQITLTLSLKHHPAGIQKIYDRLERVSDPRNPDYGQYLEPDQIIDLLDLSKVIPEQLPAFFGRPLLLDDLTPIIAVKIKLMGKNIKLVRYMKDKHA